MAEDAADAVIDGDDVLGDDVAVADVYMVAEDTACEDDGVVGTSANDASVGEDATAEGKDSGGNVGAPSLDTSAASEGDSGANMTSEIVPEAGPSAGSAVDGSVMSETVTASSESNRAVQEESSLATASAATTAHTLDDSLPLSAKVVNADSPATEKEAAATALAAASVTAPPPAPPMPALDGSAEAASDGAARAASSADTEKIDVSIVPVVQYDDGSEECKAKFFKEDRWIISKRENVPSIFCALCIRVRFEMFDNGSSSDITKLAHASIEQVLRDEIGLGAALVRWDDVDESERGREIIVALNAALPAGISTGTEVKVEKLAISAAITEVFETNDDVDPGRLRSLAKQLKQAEGMDAILMELPQSFFIPDPDFRAKQASIGLYPGSFWMIYLNHSWGTIATAEIFFRSTKAQQTGSEPMVSLAVKFRDWDSLKMCYTFLSDRYLCHPKQKHDLRRPACKLVSFGDFKAAAVAEHRAARGLGPKVAKAPAVAKAKAPVAKAKATAPPKARPLGKAPVAKRPGGVLPGAAGPPKAKAGVKAAGLADSTNKASMSPAEAMNGLSGPQLEAFQMVMTRMERLERENQELMQILLQMQGLLQQQQQRNTRLQQMVGSGSALQLDPALAGPAASIPQIPGVAAAAPGTLRAGKRKAVVVTAETEEGHYSQAQNDEDAPWKSQRKRPRLLRRPREASAAATAAPPGGEASKPPAPGLDAFHAALLSN
jgi:hypothetical protein